MLLLATTLRATGTRPSQPRLLRRSRLSPWVNVSRNPQTQVGRTICHPLNCHARGSGHPEWSSKTWIPVFTGMTKGETKERPFVAFLPYAWIHLAFQSAQGLSPWLSTGLFPIRAGFDRAFWESTFFHLSSDSPRHSWLPSGSAPATPGVPFCLFAFRVHLF